MLQPLCRQRKPTQTGGALQHGRQHACDRLTDAAHALGVFPRLALPEICIQRDERVPQRRGGVVLPPPRPQVSHQAGGLIGKSFIFKDFTKALETPVFDLVSLLVFVFDDFVDLSLECFVDPNTSSFSRKTQTLPHRELRRLRPAVAVEHRQQRRGGVVAQGLHDHVAVLHVVLAAQPRRLVRARCHLIAQLAIWSP